MKIVVIGPTLLTRHCLEALIKNGKDEITAVYTLDEVTGQKKSRFSSMDDMSVNLHKVSNINAPEVIDQIRKYEPDVIFELGWSQIISPEILSIPKKGTIGVHASLLPKNRGAASLNWSIINNESKTGVTLFYLAEKPDDGDIIAQKEFPIDVRDDIKTLHSKSDLVSSELLVENIDAIREDKVKRIKQDLDKVTHTKRRKPEDGLVDWSKESFDLYNFVRAITHPFPGAFTNWKGKKTFIWKTSLTEIDGGNSGEVLDIRTKEGIYVGTSDKALLIQRLQLEGGVEMWADDFAKKYGLKKGDKFE